jgi:hypothetical protein
LPVLVAWPSTAMCGNHRAGAQLVDEGADVVGLVGAERDPPPPRAPVQHEEPRVALGRAGRRAERGIDDQRVAVLHQ